ncbi:MAG: glycosyltransferase [Leptolyngbyaceae cyanobacterium MO_188.B28]|nr:glycosyltransferase [Leptolyngbyaceae cyanobacterium MO_188.B28]
MKTVVMFSSLLLPPSQTFIKAQAEELQQFIPYYVGCRRVQGLTLPEDRTRVINQGNLLGVAQEVLFKVSGFAPKLYQEVKQLNPVLIHAQFGLSGALALPWARSLKIPLLVHYRGADATIREEHARYSSLNHWTYFRQLEALKQEARLFLTVSKFIGDKLLEQGFPPEKVRPHYHGVDVTQFCPDPAVSRQPAVLFVGRLTEKKGVQYLIEAMAQVQAILPETELVMIGDGDLRPELEALAAKKLRRYQFLGVQPQTVVKEWMNRVSILAAPSVTASQGDSEGLPNVVLEAQAMGLAVVSTLHAGIPEAVIHEETGFLAPERDVEKLADYCLRLLKDPELRNRFSATGREHVENNFNRHRQTRVLENIYQDILQNQL